MMQSSLICTEGTSLLDIHLLHFAANTHHPPPPNAATMVAAYESRECNRLAKALAEMEPVARVYAAEINTAEKTRLRRWPPFS